MKLNGISFLVSNAFKCFIKKKKKKKIKDSKWSFLEKSSRHCGSYTDVTVN